MTPEEFKVAYVSVAEFFAEQTHLDPILFLAQMGLESAWGNSQVAHHNNLAGIKYAGGYFGSTDFGGFASYPSLEQFKGDYLRVLGLPFYENVVASAGKPLSAQITALGESIWSASHYGNPPGSDLLAYVAQLGTVVITSGGNLDVQVKPPFTVETQSDTHWFGTPGGEDMGEMGARSVVVTNVSTDGEWFEYPESTWWFPANKSLLVLPTSTQSQPDDDTAFVSKVALKAAIDTL